VEEKDDLSEQEDQYEEENDAQQEHEQREPGRRRGIACSRSVGPEHRPIVVQTACVRQ
jgi:hypothetical protein